MRHDLERAQDDVAHGPISFASWNGRYRRDHREIIATPQSGVAPVQVPGRTGGQEELGAARVRSPGGESKQSCAVEHRHRADFVWQTETGSPRPAACRVATLDEETRDHPVKQGAVVQSAERRFARSRLDPLQVPAGEAHEVDNGVGCLGDSQGAIDVTKARSKNCVQGLARK